MANLLSALRELAWLRKHAAMRSEVPTLRWASVASIAPLRVVLDGDESGEAREVSGNAAGALAVGQRVYLSDQSTLLTIIAASPAP